MSIFFVKIVAEEFENPQIKRVPFVEILHCVPPKGVG